MENTEQPKAEKYGLEFYLEKIDDLLNIKSKKLYQCVILKDQVEELMKEMVTRPQLPEQKEFVEYMHSQTTPRKLWIKVV